MTFRTSLASAVSAIVLTTGSVPALVAMNVPAAAQAADSYSAEQLDAFVAAFLEVGELRATYTEQLQAATEAEEQQAIVEQGNAAIVSAIEGVDGMDVELYSAILGDAGADEALNERVTRRLEAAAEG
jgi:hypothetical protein